MQHPCFVYKWKDSADGRAESIGTLRCILHRAAEGDLLGNGGP
ncbi:MAG TPA: hypothetical protein VH082_05450 [Rudaea sp.]|jgi:hypothetical protein|nr:hypothetical protein [Rudaea sp.]